MHHLSLFCTYESQRFFFLERSSNSGYWIYKTLKYGIYACRHVSCETRPVPTPVNGWVTRMQMQRRRKMSGHASFLGKKRKNVSTTRDVWFAFALVPPVQFSPVPSRIPGRPCLLCSRAPLTGDRRGPVLSAGNDRFWTRIILHWHVQ